MTIFTPNTVISSTDVNGNFDELKTRVDACDTIEVLFNSGGARSTSTNTSLVAIPGATGDTSYTSPADTAVTILFSFSAMINQTAGVCRAHMTINGTELTYGSYLAFISAAHWHTDVVHYRYELAANTTITIGAKWSTSAGTVQITNASSDSSYPNYILGVVVPN